MFETTETGISGCVELRPRIHADARGRFIKTWHADAFGTLDMPEAFREQYYTQSAKGVLRGLHFQRPPHAYSKLVYCVHGRVKDVVVDLRRSQPTYGQYRIIELSGESANMLYIPQGVAHGFLVLSEHATLVYNVTAAHSPAHDDGILWSSAGIPWGVENPLLSPRDQALPSLHALSSPF